MKRLTVLFLALTIPIIMVAGPLLWVYEPGLPAAGHDVLAFYLDQTNHQNANLEIIQANNPGAFTSEMSAASYGNGSYFIMSHNSNPQSLNNQNVRPLPFPPAELWCIQIVEESNRQLVLLALHQDLYKAIWAAHYLSMSDTSTTALLNQIGCQ